MVLVPVCSAIAADHQVQESTSSSKADIVWWIDTSGSMGDEAKYLNANINNFATYIEKAGIDYRIILVGFGLGVCFKPPLGGKDCEDSNLPKYTFVKQTIGSYVSVTQRTHSSLPKPPPAPAQACIRIIDPTLINHNGKRHASRIHPNISPRTNVHILLCTLFTERPRTAHQNVRPMEGRAPPRRHTQLRGCHRRPQQLDGATLH